MADTTNTPATPAASDRGNRRIVTGIVTGDKNSMTRRVEVQTLVKHPKYGKYIKQRTVCYAHDEKNESALGDTVEIMECRPLSKTKRWRLVQITKKAPSRTLSNLEGSVAGSSVNEATGKSKA
ncbi:MAG: 30S ribosomal protein S17 [Fimbriiglobus sp.]